MTTTGRDNTPYYLQISQSIRDQIVSGQYLVNDQIPSEDEIVKQCGVSRMTARHAVTQLVNEGLVYGFYEDMKERGFNPASKIIEYTKRLPNEREQHKLKIKKHQEVYYIHRIRYIDQNPVGTQTLVVPVHLVPGFENVNLETTSFYSFLNEIGSPLLLAHQHMEAVLAFGCGSGDGGTGEHAVLFPGAYFGYRGRQAG